MAITVGLRRNADGLVREIVSDIDWYDGGEYLWTDGNYGCDCNRSLFFAHAAGEDEPEQDCGETAYSIVYVDLPGGERIEGPEIS